MSEVERVVGKVLWDISMVESAAVTCLGMLSSSLVLTEAERSHLMTRLVPEEIAHDKMLRGWGQKWFGDKPRRPLAYAVMLQRDLLLGSKSPDPYRFAWMMSALYWNEQNTLRTQEQVFAVLALMGSAMQGDYRQLIHEEVGHVAWLTQVLHRLETDNPLVVALFHRDVALNRRVYPVVVHHAHAKAWDRAKELLA